MISHALLIVCLSLQYSGSGIAKSQDKVLDGWVSEPDGRGTFTILSSCVLTLSLCVYTAIHLNVRHHKQTELQSWLDTSYWVVFGILAPELVLFVAWRQYVSATSLDRLVKGLQRVNSESNETESRLAKPAQVIPASNVAQSNRIFILTFNAEQAGSLLHR